MNWHYATVYEIEKIIKSLNKKIHVGMTGNVLNLP